MDMGDDDDMNVGTIDVLWFPKLYWIFVGSVIGAFTLVNIINVLIARQRIRAGAARPSNLVSGAYATLTAVLREISNASLPSLQWTRLSFFRPTVGKLCLVLGNLILILVLDFYALDPSSSSDYENTAYRAGFLSLGQLPLIFLLAGKNNIIGWLTGSSYERLNWLHRWVSRTILLTVTLHMAYWFVDWAPYGGYISHQIKTDTQTQTGIASWFILLWIVFSSFAPIRRWSYEVFVIQHLVSMVAFITMVFVHTPSSDHGWLWPPVAIYFFDRVVRAAYAAYINLAIFHPKQRQLGVMPGLWSCRAELSVVGDDMTKVTIRNPPISWNAGQHAFISCHTIMPLQSHPFTISSLPTDGKLEFLVKARKGGTRRLRHHAEKSTNVSNIEEARVQTVAVAIEGPYGRTRSLRQFDSVVLVAGSTGATFTLPLLRDLVQHWNPHRAPVRQRPWTSPSGAVTRHIRFNWVVKSREQLQWFAEELSTAIEDVKRYRREDGADVSLEVHAYITCDEVLTTDFADEKTRPLPPAGGTTRMLSLASSEASILDEKKKDGDVEDVQIREIDSRLESGSEVSSIEQRPHAGVKTCQPDGTCCCRTAITSDAAGQEVICNCKGCSHDSPSASSSSSTTDKRKKSALHPDIILRSGRPTPRHLLLPVLEQAQGETAVVSCGPLAMNDEMRRATVVLSDERAVHKGTGAQGIWYHGEGFEY